MHEGGSRIRSLMAPDPPPRNGIGIKYEMVSRWRLKARQNERECDVSVVSGLFMALLVTAVAFAAVKFRRLWFRAEREKSPGEQETERARYIRREIFWGKRPRKIDAKVE